MKAHEEIEETEDERSSIDAVSDADVPQWTVRH
jgi:hypothetical protein